MVSRVSLVILVLKVLLVLLEMRAREAQLVSRDQPDLLVFVDLEELLELVDFLVRPVEEDQWACLAQGALLVLLVHVDLLVMVAVRVRLVWLEPEVCLVAPEAVDPKERRDLPVLLVKMAAADLLAQPDPEASLETSDSLALKDLLVSLANLARKAPRVLPV